MRERITEWLRRLILKLNKKNRLVDDAIRKSAIQSIFLNSDLITKHLQGKVIYFDALTNLFIQSDNSLPKFDIVIPDYLYVYICGPELASDNTRREYLIDNEEAGQALNNLEGVKEFFVNANSTSKLLIIPFDDVIAPETLNERIEDLINSKNLVLVYKV